MEVKRVRFRIRSKPKEEAVHNRLRPPIGSTMKGIRRVLLSFSAWTTISPFTKVLAVLTAGPQNFACSAI
jgi:hypothetical protein